MEPVYLEEIITKKREYSTSTGDQMKDKRRSESVKVIFSIDQEETYCDSTEKELNDETSHLDVDIDIDIDVEMDNDHPHISVTVSKKGLASDMITIRKLSCSNSDKWESCIIERLSNGTEIEYCGSKELIYKKGKNKSAASSLSGDRAIEKTTVSDSDSDSDSNSDSKYANLESIKAIMTKRTGHGKTYEEVEMSFEEIINEYNRIFNRPAEIFRSANGRQIENVSKRFEKWCRHSEIKLKDTKPKAKETQIKQAKRKLAVHKGVRHKIKGSQFKGPTNIKQTRIPIRIPTEKLRDEYPKASKTKNTENEAEDNRLQITYPTNVKETQIPTRVPTEKARDEYLIAKYIKNTEKEFKDNTIQLKCLTDIKETQISMGDATDISIDEYLKPRERKHTEKEVKGNTMQFKCT